MSIHHRLLLLLTIWMSFSVAGQSAIAQQGVPAFSQPVTPSVGQIPMTRGPSQFDSSGNRDANSNAGSRERPLDDTRLLTPAAPVVPATPTRRPAEAPSANATGTTLSVEQWRAIADGTQPAASADERAAARVRRYLDAGLPATAFVPPADLVDRAHLLGDSQRAAIADTLKLLDSLPSHRIGALNVLSVGKLAAFGGQAPTFDWNRLEIASRYALHGAVQLGMPLSAVSYLTPDELAAARTAQTLLLSSLAPGTQIVVYPIALDGRPVVEVKPPALPNRQPEPRQPADPGVDGTLAVGADPTGDPSRGNLPVTNPATSPMLVAAGATAGISTQYGELGKDDRNRTATAGEPGFCNTDPGKPCFLSTVALHDRFRLTCSGVLIAPDKLLTAAHCVCGGAPSLVTVGSSAPIGLDPPPAQRTTVAVSGDPSLLDPGFCPRYLKRPNDHASYAGVDLAVLTLSSSLTPGDRSPYAVLADSTRLPRLASVDVAGFGARDADPLGGEKYFAPLLVASSQCTGHAPDGRPHHNVYGCHAGHELVAIDEKRFTADSCAGDSGAGALARLKDDSYVLVGIVSRGLESTCGRGGIYTLLATPRVRTWLAEVAPGASYENGEIALLLPR